MARRSFHHFALAVAQTLHILPRTLTLPSPDDAGQDGGHETDKEELSAPVAQGHDRNASRASSIERVNPLDNVPSLLERVARALLALDEMDDLFIPAADLKGAWDAETCLSLRIVRERVELVGRTWIPQPTDTMTEEALARFQGYERAVAALAVPMNDLFIGARKMTFKPLASAPPSDTDFTQPDAMKLYRDVQNYLASRNRPFASIALTMALASEIISYESHTTRMEGAVATHRVDETRMERLARDIWEMALKSIRDMDMQKQVIGAALAKDSHYAPYKKLVGGRALRILDAMRSGISFEVLSGALHAATHTRATLADYALPAGGAEATLISGAPVAPRLVAGN